MHLPEFDACPMHSTLRASGIGRIKNSVRVHWICLISHEKVNASFIKGCGMGPWLVLVSPCLRKKCSCHMQNWVFFVLFRYFTSENRNFSLFSKSNFKMALIWKRGYFWPSFHIFESPGKSYKNSFSTYLKHIHTRILLTLLNFLPYQYWKKIRNYQVRFLFGICPGVDSYSRHFGTINK